MTNAYLVENQQRDVKFLTMSDSTAQKCKSNGWDVSLVASDDYPDLEMH
ncbi:hypothetical protein [Enterovibrio norvegicus]